MNPQLRKKLFIQKNISGILFTGGLVILLPVILAVSQFTTNFQQQAAESDISLSNNPQISQMITNKNPDYALLMKCFGKSDQSNPCTPSEKISADLNNDGVINGVDYNLLLRETTKSKITQ